MNNSSNPSIWFYNVGGTYDWKLPITLVPQLNNRKFNMALGHVLGGCSSINAMVWSRGMERDYETWKRNGALQDVLPIFKAQEDWEGGASPLRGVGGPVHIRKPGDPHPTAPTFIEAARRPRANRFGQFRTRGWHRQDRRRRGFGGRQRAPRTRRSGAACGGCLRHAVDYFSAHPRGRSHDWGPRCHVDQSVHLKRRSLPVA
jgi:choline dehydrogenase-like flavoprotein